MDNHDHAPEKNLDLCICGFQLDQAEDFPYRPIRLLSTDSKMSQILLAEEEDDRVVIVKVGCIERPAQAELNQQAIVNEAFWLHQFLGEQGIAQIRPLVAAYNRSHPTAPTAGGNGLFAMLPTLSTFSRWWKHKGSEAELRRDSKRLEYKPEDVIQTLSIPGAPKFITLDYLPGGTLTHFVGRSRLRVEMALRVAYYVAQTLATIHTHGCVHRDLKPENILFPAAPTSQSDIDHHVPTVIDFGVAAQAGTKKMVAGSRLWMAPELQDAYERHGLRVDPAADIYALGLILCFMITGRKPRRRSYDHASYVDYVNRAFEILKADAAESDLFFTGAPAEAPHAEAQDVEAQSNDINSQRLQQTIQFISNALHKDPAQRPTAQAFGDEAARLLTLYGRPIPARADDAAPLSQPRSQPTSRTQARNPTRNQARNQTSNPKTTGQKKVVFALLIFGLILAGLIVAGFSLRQFDHFNQLAQLVGVSTYESGVAQTSTTNTSTTKTSTTNTGATNAGTTKISIAATDPQPPTLIPLAVPAESKASEVEQTKVDLAPTPPISPAPTLVPLAQALAHAGNPAATAQPLQADSAADVDAADVDAAGVDAAGVDNVSLLALAPETVFHDTRNTALENSGLNIALQLEPALIITDTAMAQGALDGKLSGQLNGQLSREAVVHFAWSVVGGGSLSDVDCFHLVVWHPDQRTAVMALLPPTQVAEIDVPLPLLDGYQRWGIQIINCTQPEVVIRPALEESVIPSLSSQ